MNCLLGRIVSLGLCAVLVLAPATPARAGLGESAARQLFEHPGDFPLFPAIGSLISVASVPFLVEDAKGIAGAGLLGVPLGMGMALMGQSLFGEKPDLPKAFVSGLGSTLAALPFAMMAGPAAPLVLFGASMGGSFAATWALDWWRARQKQQPAADTRRTAGGPAGGTVPQGGMSLLGLGSR